MTEPAVLYSRDGFVATLTLNRPENRNAMTRELLEAFQGCVTRARADGELRVVVVTGRGRSFCSGADFRASGTDEEAGRETTLHERLLRTYEPFLSILDLAVPTIAAMNGHAIGGGLGLALLCDLRIASREAKYGANFARLGLHSGMAISYLLPRIVGLPRAADLLLSGRVLTGEEAESVGLVHTAVPGDGVSEEADQRARSIAACAPLAVRQMKRSLYRGMGWDPRSGAAAEAVRQAETLQTEDVREGIRALLEKREPRFTGR